MPAKDISSKIEVINMKNTTTCERGRVINMPVSQDHTLLCTYSSSQSVKAVKALHDQVQSLHDTVSILEQRLTVLEEKLKKT